MVQRADDAELKRALSPRALRALVPGAGPQVVDVRHFAYVDSLGDDALQVFVILADDTKGAQLRWENLGPIRHAIHEAVRVVQDDRYPYVRFLTRQEYRETRS